MSTMAMKSRMVEVTGCPIDKVTGFCALTLLIFGVILVASASSEVSAKLYENSFFLVSKHVAFVVISVVISLGVLAIPIKVWQRLDWVLLLLAIVLLIAVLIPGIGREVNGSTRWIPLGPVSIQGSEFAKVFSVIYMSGYLVRRSAQVQEFLSSFLQPLFLMSLLVILLLKQPDFGAAIVIMGAVMGMTFLADVPFRRFLPVIFLLLILSLVIALWQPYRLERFSAFINPWEHQYGSGYQLTQALIAFGRGEVVGVGLGNSIQKLFFLPEAHTDFLFSIVSEELGILGAIALVTLITCLVVRGIFIGTRARQQNLDFHANLAFGASLLIGIQSLINLGVNVGMLPTKGLTLPLVSFGGNSLIVSCILVAILLRIDYETRLSTRRKTTRG